MPRQHLDRPFGDAERFAQGLQDDSRLDRVKLGAGVLSVVALVAMFVTSLFRVPNFVVTVVLAALAVGLSLAISAAVVRRNRAACQRHGMDSHTHVDCCDTGHETDLAT